METQGRQSMHLAELHAVEPRALVQAVKRNIDRFPDDFMFQLSGTEFKNLKSQFVISSWGGLRRATPYANSGDIPIFRLQCSAGMGERDVPVFSQWLRAPAWWHGR